MTARLLLSALSAGWVGKVTKTTSEFWEYHLSKFCCLVIPSGLRLVWTAHAGILSRYIYGCKCTRCVWFSRDLNWAAKTSAGCKIANRPVWIKNKLQLCKLATIFIVKMRSTVLHPSIHFLRPHIPRWGWREGGLQPVPAIVLRREGTRCTSRQSARGLK